MEERAHTFSCVPCVLVHPTGLTAWQQIRLHTSACTAAQYFTAHLTQLLQLSSCYSSRRRASPPHKLQPNLIMFRETVPSHCAVVSAGIACGCRSEVRLHNHVHGTSTWTSVTPSPDLKLISYSSNQQLYSFCKPSDMTVTSTQTSHLHNSRKVKRTDISLEGVS
jgi:hypothetical protein